MTPGTDHIAQEALAWAARTGDPAFDDWDGFTLWLEAEPGNAAAYHRIMGEVEDGTELLRSAPRPIVTVRPAVNRRRWIGGAIAASLAGVIGWTALETGPRAYTIETAIGERREIALADGSRIALNGGTRLILDRNDIRSARLEQGAALFTVVHDEARPFRVAAGADEIVDVGTVFSVERSRDFIAVQVSDGAVVFNPTREAVRLNAGRGLTSGAGADAVRVGAVDPETVGGFARGRLDYAGAPLAEVLGDVRQATGLAVTPDAAVAGRPFHGTIRLDTIAADPARLGPLLGVTVTRRGGGWRAVPTP